MSETILVLRNIQEAKIKNIYWYSRKIPAILVIFKKKKLEISGQILKKYSNIKFNENLSSGSQVAPCGQTDRQAW